MLRDKSISCYERKCYFMEEIRKINHSLAKKQIGRFILGIGSVIFGGVLIGKFIHQRGVTDCQMALSITCPEEYEAMTKKIAKLCENHK